MTVNNDVVATIDAAAFHRAAYCVSTEEVRSYLQGVCIQPAKAGGVFVVATDGHCLSCSYDPAGSAVEQVLVTPNSKMLTAIRKVVQRVEPDEVAFDDVPHVRLRVDRPRGGDTRVELFTSIETVSIDTPVFVCAAPETDNFRYADWQRVIPKPTQQNERVPCIKDATGTVESWFNFALFEKLRKGLAVRKGVVTLAMVNTDKEHGAVVSCGDLRNWFGMVMPMRGRWSWETRHAFYADIWEKASQGVVETPSEAAAETAQAA